SSTRARSSTPPSSARRWSRCWPRGSCCGSSARSRSLGGRAPPSSTTGRRWPSGWPSPATSPSPSATPTPCGECCTARCRSRGPAASDPAGTRRSTGPTARRRTATSAGRRSGSEQEAEGPAHDRRLLGGGGDVLEAEAEQERGRCLHRGGGAGAVPGRPGSGPAPARPLDPVAGGGGAGQGRVGRTERLGGGREGGGVAAGGHTGGGERPGEPVERCPHAVDGGDSGIGVGAAGRGVLEGPQPVLEELRRQDGAGPGDAGV